MVIQKKNAKKNAKNKIYHLAKIKEKISPKKKIFFSRHAHNNNKKKKIFLILFI